MNDFEDEINKRLSLNRENKALQDAKLFFLKESILPKYSYNFLGLVHAYNSISTRYDCCSRNYMGQAS